MSDLSVAAVIVGAVFVLAGLPAVLRPALASRLIQAFPRSVWAGRLLTALDLAWVTWLLFHSPLGWFEPAKQLLWVLGPVAFLLVIFFVDELLAPRALGGLLMLAASPVLDVARWHTSHARFFMTVMAYVWVIAGIVLTVSPYRFRQAAAYWIAAEARCRMAGIAVVALGVAVAALGYAVY